jgi:hypothetical protein
MHCRKMLALLVWSILSAVVAKGQSTSASLSGQITDTQNLVIVGAEVQAVNQETGVVYPTKTNSDGFFSIPDLPPGAYELRISKTGFRTMLRPDIILHVADSRALNATLQVGDSAEIVRVEGGASMINTTDASVSTVVDRQFAENLPLNGRSFQTLIEMTPGVVFTEGLGQFSVNGQRAISNYWMVDGVSANIGVNPYAPGTLGANGMGGSTGAFSVLGGTNSLVSVDALQEFRIETSTYAPEFGRTPGGQISIATRSGTNQFHGTLFDYLRNNALDANDWFANATKQPKPEERQNDFGGTIAGPIVKDRTFFFFSYEGLRLRLPQVSLTSVPDAAARMNAQPAIQPFLNAYPVPNGADNAATGVAQFNASYSNPASLDAYSLRIDQKLSSKWALFGRYNYSPSSFFQRGAGSALSDVLPVKITTQTATAGATWMASATITNDLRFNYSKSEARSSIYLDNFGGATPPSLATIQASNLIPSPNTLGNGVFTIAILGLTNNTVGAGQGQTNSQPQINLVDGLSVQKGSHSLKFGADFRRLAPESDPQLYRQLDEFRSLANAEAQNLFFSALISSQGSSLVFRDLGAYAQDTWRATARLSITYGLRWDIDFVPTTSKGPSLLAVTGFNLTDLSGLALAPAGTPVFSTKYGNVAPRIGVAYQVSQSQKRQTVVRGGFGGFFDLADQEISNALTPTQFPFAGRAVKIGGTFPLSASAASAPPPATAASLASGGALFGFDPNLELPYTLQWNVALEQALGDKQTVSASYVGASGRRLVTTEFVAAPNSSFANANLVSNGGASNYNALQVQFQRRLSHGLQTLASYVFSHSIDTGSNGGFANGDIRNLSTNRGSSDFDIRHVFSTALTYEVPTPRINAFARGILGGWSIQSIVQVHSAPPIDINEQLLNQQLSAQGAHTNIRPDVISGIPLYLYGPQYPGRKAINNTPGAVVGGCPADGSPSVGPFCPPPYNLSTGIPLRQGDLGRNALRGFGASQWDFAVHRDIPIRESLKLQFRAEMFNVLNHPNFGPPDVGLSDPTFGVTTQMLGQSLSGSVLGSGGLNPLYQIGGPRSIQLALKLLF